MIRLRTWAGKITKGLSYSASLALSKLREWYWVLNPLQLDYQSFQSKLADQGRVMLVALAMSTKWPLTDELLPSNATPLRYYPLVGALLGLLAGLVYTLATSIGLSVTLAALLAVGALVIMTGVLHEDGLADCCDGLAGGSTSEAKIMIMRDSRLGSYGAMALFGVLMLRVMSIAALPSEPLLIIGALVASCALSRTVIVGVMTYHVPVGSGIPISDEEKPDKNLLLHTVGIAAGVSWLAVGWLAALISLVMAGLGAMLLARAITRLLGGYTSDVLGTIQQGAEVLVWLTLVILLS